MASLATPGHLVVAHAGAWFEGAGGLDGEDDEDAEEEQYDPYCGGGSWAGRVVVCVF